MQDCVLDHTRPKFAGFFYSRSIPLLGLRGVSCVRHDTCGCFRKCSSSLVECASLFSLPLRLLYQALPLL